MVAVRPLREEDLDEAERIRRLAFGTQLGLPDPLAFGGDNEYAHTRWRADASAALAAEVEGALAGSNFATRWGSFAFFGPLSVRPELWNQGVAHHLLDATMEIFARWAPAHAGLYAVVNSPKHAALYQKYGFWPRFMTFILARPVRAGLPSGDYALFSSLSLADQEACLADCGELCDAVFDGLDVSREIRAVHVQGLGDTLLLWDMARLAGFAVCHCGAGSEAGSGACYVKFAAVLPGPGAPAAFERLLAACEAYAAQRGLGRLVCGVNLARHEAYRGLLAAGFRIESQGVAMQRPNEAGFNRPGVYVIDDWR